VSPAKTRNVGDRWFIWLSSPVSPAKTRNVGDRWFIWLSSPVSYTTSVVV
jgi:hypothetical protein